MIAKIGIRTTDAKIRIFLADILPPNVALAWLKLRKKFSNQEISLRKNYTIIIPRKRCSKAFNMLDLFKKVGFLKERKMENFFQKVPNFFYVTLARVTAETLRW